MYQRWKSFLTMALECYTKRKLQFNDRLRNEYYEDVEKLVEQEIDYVDYIVDRAGKIITLEGIEVEFESIINGSVELGEATESTETEIKGFEVAVPMEGHTGITLRNLVNMVCSKQVLIKKSFGITDNLIEDDFCNNINEGKMETLEDFKTAIEGAGENRY